MHFRLLLYVCLISAASCFAADYYVSPAGHDSNPGTASAPWATIAKVNATRFVPGDRILFAAGATFTGNIEFDEAGTPDAPIVISSYGQGRATINAGTGYGILVYNAAGFSISNLKIIGSGTATNAGSGIFFYTDLTNAVRMPYIRVDAVEMTGFGAPVVDKAVNDAEGWGIVIMSDSPKAAAGYTDIRLTNIVAYGNAVGGIQTIPRWDSYPPGPGLAFSNVYVGYSKTYSNPGVSGLINHSGNGILLQGVDGGLVEHNVAYNNGYLSNGSSGGPVGIWTAISNNVVIQYNESYSNRTAGVHDGGGFDLDGGTTNSILQYNYSHDNDGGGIELVHFAGVRAWSGNIVRYNVSVNDARKNSYGAIVTWTGNTAFSNAQIYNNTVYISPATSGTSSAVRLMNSTRDFAFRNNLLLATGTAKILNVAGTQTNLLFQGNDYWNYSGKFAITWVGTAYSTFYAWQAATGQEKVGTAFTGFNVDPQINVVLPVVALNNLQTLDGLTAYRLAASSPVVDKGLDLRTFSIDPGAGDFFGSALPQGGAFDIGAHERSLDTAPPSSHVNMAVVGTDRTTLALSWSGSDDNSGIASYSVYVSKNGGAFVQWLSDTTASGASFSGEAGSTYGFFCVARDKAGNVERMKNAAEASASVAAVSTSLSSTTVK